MTKRVIPVGKSTVEIPETPLASFDPLEATDDELRRFGMLRPKRDSELALWRELFARKPTYVAAELKPRVRRQSVMRPGPADPTRNDIVTSVNWSGSMQAAPAGTAVTTVNGMWTVPYISTPPADGRTYDASIWVGIGGGAASTSLVQAGTAQDFTNGSLETLFFFEWVPSASQLVTSLAVSPGQVVLVMVGATSATSATVVFTNVSTNHYTTFVVNAPANTTLDGSSTEWIVEHDDASNGTPNPLANFGGFLFTSGAAGYAPAVGSDTIGDIYPNGGQLIQMRDLLNNHMADTSLFGGFVFVSFKSSD
jgi:hypothetical protein